MALLGGAAMLLWYDIVPEQIAEHDDWHTRQHFPERLGIPGFMRAQRWVASSPGPRYFIVYEVSDLDVLTSAPYLERLNNPTAWTSRTMPSFRGMVRGFCRLEGSHGSVLGTSALSLRYGAAPGMGDPLRHWVDRDLIPKLLERRGIASAFAFRSDRAPEMTAEQRIRGRDASVDLALLITGYSHESIAALATNELSSKSLEEHGASSGAALGIFQLACLASGSSTERTLP